LPIAAAAGHVVAGDVRSLVDIPAFDTAAMDGWAVRGTGPWRVVGEVVAGDAAVTVGAGEAVRISTGAVVPQGAGVLRSEHGVEHGDDVMLLAGAAAPAPGHDTRTAGEEVRCDELVLKAGSVLTPPAIGLAAAAGLDVLDVVPRPSVALLVLGDELVAGGVPRQGQVRDALSPQLPGWVDALHGSVTAASPVKDSLEATVGALDGATDDVIITTGGTARGRADHVLGALTRVGGRWIVDGVAVRPGHPMKLGQLPDGRLWIALPGNPLAAVSALVTIGEPLFAALSGRPWQGASEVHRPLAEPVESSPGAHRLIPATISDGLVTPTLRRGPAMLTGLSSADVLTVVPPGPARLERGEAVRVLPLPWGSGLVV
jgi:molybdopterin molybdotransferase